MSKSSIFGIPVCGMLLMGTFYVGLGCNKGGNETAEETSQFEVASPEPIEDGEEPTISSLAELAGVSPSTGTSGDMDGGVGEPGTLPPSLAGTDLNADQLALPDGGVNQIQAFLQQIYRRRGSVSTEAVSYTHLTLPTRS